MPWLPASMSSSWAGCSVPASNRPTLASRTGLSAPCCPLMQRLFSFTPATPFTSCIVIVTMQDVNGVAGVKLKSLCIKGQQGALNPVLEAKVGRLEAGTLHPAQLLLIDAGNQGIILIVD